MSFLENKIKQANAENKMALIPFVTAGFPSKEKFWSVIEDLDQDGAHIIEIGVPFTDPVADGPVVEEASIRALAQGVDLKWIFEGLQQRKLQAGIVLMGYYNPFLQYGIKELAAQCKLSGVHGCIIPDLPLEESLEVRQILLASDVDLIALVGLNTSLERMQEYSAISTGYVYVVSVLGITGSPVDVTKIISEMLIRAKKAFKIPISLGFGLQSPDQLDGIAKENKPDAVVFGSALLSHIDAGHKVKDFLDIWKK